MLTVAPFTPVAAAQELVRVVNENKEENHKLKEVLMGDMTTVEGRTKLVRYAMEHGWFKESHADSVVVGTENNYKAFIEFRQTFSDALNFFMVSVEGNNRIIALTAGMLKTIISKNMTFTPKQQGMEGFLSKQSLGIDVLDDQSNDAMGSFFDGTSSNSATKPNTEMRFQLIVAREQATVCNTAETLVRDLILPVSKKASDVKLKSSRPSIASRGLYTMGYMYANANKRSGENDSVTRGFLYEDGTLIDQKRKKDRSDLSDLKDDALFGKDRFSRFTLNPAIGGEEFKDAMDAFHMIDQDGNKLPLFHDTCLDSLLGPKNLKTNESDTSLMSNHKRFLTFMLGKDVFEMNHDHLLTLLFSGFVEDAILPKFDIPKKLSEVLKSKVESWQIGNEDGLKQALLSFMMDVIIAGNVLKKEKTVQNAFNKFALEMTNDDMRNSLGKEIGESRNTGNLDTLAIFTTSLTALLHYAQLEFTDW